MWDNKNTNFNKSYKSSVILNGIYDNIIVDFKYYNKRYIINPIDNTRKIWLFDIRKMKSEINGFDFIKYKLNHTMSIEYDGSDLIF